MNRRSLAAVLVTCGFFAPVTAVQAGGTPSAAATTVASSAALPRAVPAPDAPIADRCASRSKQVKRLKRRLRSAKTERGKARAHRRLNASRRSLTRCRARKAPVAPSPAPGPLPTPTPNPAPVMPAPAPVPIPEFGEPAITVNGGANGVFAPSAALRLDAVNLPALPDGSLYHFEVRTPLIGIPPPGGWQGCRRRNADAITFTGGSGSTTFVPAPAWCQGASRAFVWVGPPGMEFMSTNDVVAAVSFTVAADVIVTAG
jgi:hypothetical protein